MGAYYQYIKALHIIFVITWFAGLFYIPRLFIYHIEASGKPEPEKHILTAQFKLMARRLWYIITWPSLVLASGFAFWMLYLNPGLFYAPWMQVKLGFIVILYAYHGYTHKMFLQLQHDVIKYTSGFMRLWNEGATVILFSVVFLAILKSSINWIFGVAGLFILILLLTLGIKLYKHIRAKK
ncbi:MAG: CopD family protein [Bacteroidota bacterium]